MIKSFLPNMKVYALTGLQIALIIVGVLLVLAGVFVLLFKFVFEKNRLRKQIRDLDRRFQHLHALVIGQDLQWVKRLEIIARSNLLYVDIHTKFLKRFKEVRDKYDTHSQSVINNLKDLADDKKYKTLKEALVDAKEVINIYEKEVNGLNNALLQVLKPEEECRQAAISLKERLRSIKQDYYSKQADLQMMVQSFDAIFEKIDSLFEEFEDYVEGAHYDDANNILPSIDKFLLNVSNSMSELPNLCAMVISYIPEKISSLENAYEVMIHENYPCDHLNVMASIKEMRNEVNEITVKIKQFNLRGVAEELNDIATRIDDLQNKFQEERKAREAFESDNETTYRGVNTIERRFIKLNNSLPQISRIYIINQEHQGKINSIQNDINKLGATKRTLDTLIHSAQKQPYSALLKTMSELSEASKTVIESMDEFQKYLYSLREDSEKAYKLAFDFYDAVRNAESTIEKINIESISEKHKESIDRFYELINDVIKTLGKAPIDVDHVNVCVEELSKINQEVLSNEGTVIQDYNLMMLAERSIVVCNRDRHKYSDVDALLNNAEELFNLGNFEESYRISADLVKKIHLYRAEEKRNAKK